jgi:hypothetical protein
VDPFVQNTDFASLLTKLKDEIRYARRLVNLFVIQITLFKIKAGKVVKLCLQKVK